MVPPAQKSPKTAFDVRSYIKNVIRCQRIFRAAFIRSRRRKELATQSFEDFETVSFTLLGPNPYNKPPKTGRVRDLAPCNRLSQPISTTDQCTIVHPIAVTEQLRWRAHLAKLAD